MNQSIFKSIVLFFIISSYSFGQDFVSFTEPTPVVKLPYYQTAMRPGWEERDERFNKWLAVGVRFSNGSGTICYYDSDTKWAYVISAGHLFSGSSLKFNSKNKPTTRFLDVFYHNNKKLKEPRRYTAEVLCYRNFVNGIYDVSLCRFKPDWDIEWYASIAPADYKLEKGKEYHSTGCDGLTPVAHYLVEHYQERQVGNFTEIITQKNGPRGGRSGGGVMDDEGNLLFICSRGNSSGTGYWSSLQQIHYFLMIDEPEFSFLLNVGRKIPKLIPVTDAKNPTKAFPANFIPLPN